MNPEVRLQAEKYMALEECLLQITGRNYRQVALDVKSSIFVQNADLLPYFVNLILTVVHLRPRNIDLYAKLVHQMIESDDPGSEMADLKPSLVRSIIHLLSAENAFPEHTALPHFLCRLIEQRVLSFHDFCAIARLYHPGSILSPLSKKWLFCVFAPEFEDVKPEFFHGMLPLFEQQEDNKLYANVFRKFADDIDKLREENWSVHRRNRRCDFDCSSLCSIIEYDQVNYLEYQAQGSRFNPNERVEPSIFLRSAALQHWPTLLQFAAFCGSTRCFKFLLSQGADPTVPDESGAPLSDYVIAGGRASLMAYIANLASSTALHIAVVHHQHLFFRGPVEVSPTACDRHNLSLMQYSVITNNVHAFFHCLDLGANPDQGWRGGCTALHIAALHGNLMLCRILVSLYPERLNQPNASGATPLHEAVASRNDKVVLFFLEHEGISASATNVDGRTPLHAAAEAGVASIVRLILSADADINARDGRRGDGVFGRTIPRHKLLPSQEIVMADRDRVRHARAACSGRTPLHIAALRGRLEAVEALLAHYGVDPNCRTNAGQTPLERAADAGNLVVVSVLLEDPRVDVNASDGLGWTALHSACCRGHADIVKLLLSRENLRVNQRRVPGRAAIHDAADRGHLAVLRALLAHAGIDANARDCCSATPLQCAIERGWVDTARVLAGDPRVNVTVRNAAGEIALHVAVRKNQADIAAALLARMNTDVNAKDAAGVTPLTLAVRMGHLRCVEQLLRHPDINVAATDKAGQTALMAAMRGKLTKIVDVIKGYSPRKSTAKCPFGNGIRIFKNEPTIKVSP
jgi:ankyrin repeat protein